jgi:hypothetical protein
MNNEPVAWMQMTPNKQRITKISFVKTWEDDVPLYTHPANPKYDPETGEPLIDGYPLFSGLPPPPAKTLTDEDLFKVYADLQENYTGNNFPVDLGRAILRKAQEK